MIPYGRQNIIDEDVEAVIKILKSDYLTQGPTTPIFENNLKEYTNTKYSVALINATSALHIACLSLGLSKGDFLWTSPISFVASANCARYCGAEIDFVDIDSSSYNLCPIALEEKLIQAKKNKRLPKIIIPVHLSGQSCEMKRIKELSDQYGFKIIEDASHAIGGEYRGKKIGNCEYSDITVFSFHPVKIITTCEGGACMTNQKKIYKNLQSLRSHGITRDPIEMINKKPGEWYYEQIQLGFNYRLNDLQAALGISQLKRVDEFVRERNSIANYYNKIFKGHQFVRTPKLINDVYSSYHLYIIRVDSIKRKNIFDRLRNSGVFVNIHYIPIYKHPYYKDIESSSLTNSENYYKEAISIPIFPFLKKEMLDQIKKVIDEVDNFQSIF
mgnify:CR=1 FL=1|tara:strand:+ start:351 stop:1508 length:1158 start_codon:yes stop_codon:yes gene_type:complete